MLSLGIEDPVTKEAFSNKDEYHLHLAMELCNTFDKLVLVSWHLSILNGKASQKHLMHTFYIYIYYM